MSSSGAPPRRRIPPQLATKLEAWLAQEKTAWCPPLQFSELRRGVQALSRVYVQVQRGQRGKRARSGTAKRAAFALFYAPLHFITAWQALKELAPQGLDGTQRILDLGCGTGAVGVAAALHTDDARIQASDLSSAMRSSVFRTWRSFGLKGRFSRRGLPSALGWPRGGELLCFGWVLNELSAEERDETLRRVESGLRKGARLLVLEPLAGRVAPWWPDVARRLEEHGVTEQLVKFRTELPGLVGELDQAAGMDHSILGARVLLGPL